MLFPLIYRHLPVICRWYMWYLVMVFLPSRTFYEVATTYQVHGISTTYTIPLPLQLTTYHLNFLRARYFWYGAWTLTLDSGPAFETVFCPDFECFLIPVLGVINYPWYSRPDIICIMLFKLKLKRSTFQFSATFGKFTFCWIKCFYNPMGVPYC